MPNIETARIDQLGDEIETEIVPLLEEANELLPTLRSLDQTLYTTVHYSLALAYTGATSYMFEMIRGAAECFQGLNQDLTATAESWADADDATANDFK
ncbi:hypothetical protein [Glycomyces sp. NRRL B-16210]|uniref:hypothetical protein n=1 Tax=Glycomyces sp. NRRL B-16210 TaxID=1463821 RepID=UPI0004C249BD|nr:hypothetical protein [Glycomyces sp. NRRL B-16210]